MTKESCSVETTDRLVDAHGILDRCSFITLLSFSHFQVGTQNFQIFKYQHVMILLFKFEEGVLEICFHLLRRANGGRVNAAMMSDPVKMSRTISKIVGAITANPCSTLSAYPVCIPQSSFSSLFLFLCSWIAKMMKAYSLATGLGTMKEGGSQHIGLEVPRYFINTRKTMGNLFVLVNAGYFLA